MAVLTLRRLFGAGQEGRLVDSLRAGDEDAFAALVDRYHVSLVRVATAYVRDRGVAEEVAQETWLAVLNGIDGFERRSSLSTWIFRILVNQAKTRATRERRSVPFSTLEDPNAGIVGPAVDPERFGDAGAWSSPPMPWPYKQLLEREAKRLILRTIDRLSPSQRAVITLRDVHGLPAQDVCNVLGITETNQRVLLHRARSHVRHELEEYFDEEWDS